MDWGFTFKFLQCDQKKDVHDFNFHSVWLRDGGRQVQALLIYWEDLLSYNPPLSRPCLVVTCHCSHQSDGRATMDGNHGIFFSLKLFWVPSFSILLFTLGHLENAFRSALGDEDLKIPIWCLGFISRRLLPMRRPRISEFVNFYLVLSATSYSGCVLTRRDNCKFQQISYQ